jgi:hypothetical protein
MKLIGARRLFSPSVGIACATIAASYARTQLAGFRLMSFLEVLMQSSSISALPRFASNIEDSGILSFDAL